MCLKKSLKTLLDPLSVNRYHWWTPDPCKIYFMILADPLEPWGYMDPWLRTYALLDWNLANLPHTPTKHCHFQPEPLLCRPDIHSTFHFFVNIFDWMEIFTSEFGKIQMNIEIQTRGCDLRLRNLITKIISKWKLNFGMKIHRLIQALKMF